MSLQHRITRLDNAKWHGKERPLSAVNLIVLHATASSRTSTARGVIAYMNNHAPAPVSYHYLIERNGDMVRMCDPKYTAYHAGVSAWPKAPVGRESVNGRSIGISFVNDNLREMLTAAQLDSGEWLCRVWMQKLGIGANAIVAHREVSPGRKTDPVALPLGAWRRQLQR